MADLRIRDVLVLVLALGGCGFDASGLGHGGEEIGDEADGSGGDDRANTGDPTGAETGVTSDSVTDDGASTSVDTTATDDSDAETANPGAALVEIEDAPMFDYGPVAVADAATHAFLLRNVGGAPATDLGATIERGPFALAGDWPGAQGTCGTTLEPGAECTASIGFGPTLPGIVQRNLAIHYDDGNGAAQSECALRGAGTGATGNLVVNGDAETQSAPPTGWTEVAGSEWYTAGGESGMSPHGGAFSIWPATANDAELAQEIPVSKFAEAIEHGGLRFEFGVWMRSYTAGQDPRKTILEYLADDDTVLATFDTDWDAGTTWELYADDREAPAGTTAIRVRLLCDLASGVYCDGAYDDISLRGVYP